MIQYLPDLEKWQKETKFGLNTLDRNYTNLYVALDAHEFLKDITYTSVTNIFLEKCLMQILSDSDPKTNQCDISPSCRSILINSSSIYTGYSATKRLQINYVSIVERKITLQGTLSSNASLGGLCKK